MRTATRVTGKLDSNNKYIKRYSLFNVLETTKSIPRTIILLTELVVSDFIKYRNIGNYENINYRDLTVYLNERYINTNISADNDNIHISINNTDIKNTLTKTNEPQLTGILDVISNQYSKLPIYTQLNWLLELIYEHHKADNIGIPKVQIGISNAQDGANNLDNYTQMDEAKVKGRDALFNLGIVNLKSNNTTEGLRITEDNLINLIEYCDKEFILNMLNNVECELLTRYSGSVNRNRALELLRFIDIDANLILFNGNMYLHVADTGYAARVLGPNNINISAQDIINITTKGLVRKHSQLYQNLLSKFNLLNSIYKSGSHTRYELLNGNEPIENLLK